MARKKNHIEHFDERKLRLLGFVSFIYGFSQALLIYVLSDYFRESFGNDNVSVFYFTSYVIALVGLLNIHKFVKGFGKRTMFSLFFFVQLCFVTFLVFVKPSFIGVLLLMLYIIADYLVWVAMDMMLEEFSQDAKSGRIRGLHLTILNIGFIAGPVISTRILSHYGFHGLFFVAMLMNMIMFAVGLIGMQGVPNKKFEEKLTVRDLVKKIFVNKDLIRIYLVSCALEFFYALMIIYTPLYLLDRGLTWLQIGTVFTVMLIPFVVIEYPIGFLADKKFGEKEMLITGLVIMALSSGSMFFIAGSSVFVWSSVLLFTRIGAAAVEILRDSYFYKKIDGRDVDLISFFRTARSTAYILATACSALALIFFELRYTFLIVAVVVMLGIYPAVKLMDNKSEAEL